MVAALAKPTGLEQDSGRWRGLNHVIDEQSLFTHGVDVTVERAVSELELTPGVISSIATSSRKY